jgi:pimeloyl-ACP methyl ester carboxylesterase
MTDEDVADRWLGLPDGRTIAWTECGSPDGVPLLRFPGVPGSRWVIRADRTPWEERALHVITSERPGFGRSTRLPGRGFAEHADDMALLLEHLGVDEVYVCGASGAAPHILAFAARHPDRVRAATVIAGAARLTSDDADRMIPINKRAYDLVGAGDEAGLRELLSPIAESMVADPLSGFRQLMASAPSQDQAVMSDADWQRTFVKSVREALVGGIDGWVDESLALFGDWSDVAISSVTTSLTWYHTVEDRNAPIAAARRLVGSLPNARLVEWPEGGHFAAYYREREILDELLSR